MTEEEDNGVLPFTKTSSKWKEYEKISMKQPHFSRLKNMFHAERFALVDMEIYVDMLLGRRNKKPPPYDQTTLESVCSHSRDQGFDVSEFDNWWSDFMTDFSDQLIQLEKDVSKARQTHDRIGKEIAALEESFNAAELKTKLSELERKISCFEAAASSSSSNSEILKKNVA